MINMDLTNEKDVTEFMAAATTMADWNERCRAVKAANHCEYPSFWRSAVLQSGVAAQSALAQ